MFGQPLGVAELPGNRAAFHCVAALCHDRVAPDPVWPQSNDQFRVFLSAVTSEFGQTNRVSQAAHSVPTKSQT
jgi:hypothetical protein